MASLHPFRSQTAFSIRNEAPIKSGVMFSKPVFVKEWISQSINQSKLAQATSLNRLMRQSIMQRDKLEILKLYVYKPKFRRNEVHI